MDVFCLFKLSAPRKIAPEEYFVLGDGEEAHWEVRKLFLIIDLIHEDITCPEGSMGVVAMLKSKMAASSASSGGNSKIIVSSDLSESSNKSPKPLLNSPATSEHMSALLPFKFPALGKYNAILDLFVTTTTTMHL